MAHAHEALRLIADLETGLRGYLIAGEKPFLDPYRQGLEQIEQELGELKELLQKKWEEVVTSQTGLKNYEELRAACP